MTKELSFHKYGDIWLPKGKSYEISRVDVERVAYELGFRLYNNDLYIIRGIVLFPATERDFQDAMRNYLEDVGQINFKDIVNQLEYFLQKHGKYTISRLSIITQDQFLYDTPTSCYKFYTNGWIQITPIEIFYRDYTQFPEGKLLLSTKINQREYNKCDDGKYLEFLKLSTNWKDNEVNIKSIIGYLCHEYKDETTGYIIVLTEQCPDPKDGGGSGKNLFCNLLSYSTTYHSKNGSQVKFDENFFQSWNGQRLMGISDVPKNFNFEFLKEPSTGTFILKKLYKDQIEIPVSQGPKFIVQTNYSYEISDGGLRRRIIPIEFTDFFTKAGGIDAHFNCHFPTGWTKEDWYNYDTVIIDSIQTWMIEGRKLTASKLTETGWEKQFENSYGANLTEFIRDNFEQWCFASKVPSKEIQGALKSFYDSRDVAKTYRSTSQRIASAIKEWSKHYGYICDPNKSIREGLVVEKYYNFNKLP